MLHTKSKVIGLLVLEMKILKVIYLYIYGCSGHLSRVAGPFEHIFVPDPSMLAQLVVRKMMFETADRRRTDEQTTDNWVSHLLK